MPNTSNQDNRKKSEDTMRSCLLPHPYMLEKIVDDTIQRGELSVPRLQEEFQMGFGFASRTANSFAAAGITEQPTVAGSQPRKLLIKDKDIIMKKMHDFAENNRTYFL